MNDQSPENPTGKPLDKPLQILRNNAYLLLCGINFILIDQVFRYCNQVETLAEFSGVPANLFSIAWILIFLAIIFILPGKIKKATICILTSLYLILIFIHCGMFSFNGSFMSFSDIMFADDGAKFFHAEYISIPPQIIITAICSIVLMIVSIKIAPEKKCEKKHISAVIAVSMFFCGIITICTVEKQWFSDYVSVSWDNYRQYSDIYQSFNDPGKSMILTGLYQYTFRDLWLTSGIERLLQGESKIVNDITVYYSANESTPGNAMTGALKDKNLILIQLEAIDTWMLTEEAMPNLYELQKNSIQFTNHFAPLYLSGGTFNTEIMVNIGHFPPTYGGKTSVYTNNEFPMSLANLFTDQNYTARSFHNIIGDVYSREQAHNNWGYEQYYSGDDIGMYDTDFDSCLISGFPLMTEGSPFFTFIITYSGHGPYEDSDVSAVYYDKFASLHPDAESEYIHALAHAYETDLFIGLLVAQLKEHNLWENTALIFYSDHYNYYTLDDDIVKKYKETDSDNLIRKVPFFIYSEDLPAQKIEKVTSSIDILPTIINLFDLPANKRFYAGYDGFSDAGGYVIFEDNSWYDGTNSGTETADPNALERKNEISERLYYSNNVLLTDYYSYANPSFYR